MTTQTQLEVNCRYAQRSTGPRTPEGKAVSSMNALQSGIHADSSIIPGEDAAGLVASPHGSTRVASGKAFDNTVNTQSRLQRRINDAARLQREAILDLQRLQAARPHPQPQPTAPQPLEPESSASPIGFVPQTPVMESAPGPAAQPFGPQNAPQNALEDR